MRCANPCAKSALPSAPPPSILTCLAPPSASNMKGYLQREDTNAAILKQAEAGASIKEVVRLTGHSRGLVRRVLRGQRSDVFRVRESSLEHHLPWLDAQWAAGHHNGADLWRRLKVLGFRGSVRVVTEWATRRRRAEKADAQSLHRVPSARTIARLMTTGRDTLSKSETVTIAAIEDGVPLLVEAREVVDNIFEPASAPRPGCQHTVLEALREDAPIAQISLAMETARHDDEANRPT